MLRCRRCCRRRCCCRRRRRHRPPPGDGAGGPRQQPSRQGTAQLVRGGGGTGAVGGRWRPRRATPPPGTGWRAADEKDGGGGGGWRGCKPLGGWVGRRGLGWCVDAGRPARGNGLENGRRGMGVERSPVWRGRGGQEKAGGGGGSGKAKAEWQRGGLIVGGAGEMLRGEGMVAGCRDNGGVATPAWWMAAASVVQPAAPVARRLWLGHSPRDHPTAGASRTGSPTPLPGVSHSPCPPAAMVMDVQT